MGEVSRAGLFELRACAYFMCFCAKNVGGTMRWCVREKLKTNIQIKKELPWNDFLHSLQMIINTTTIVKIHVSFITTSHLCCASYTVYDCESNLTSEISLIDTLMDNLQFPVI